MGALYYGAARRTLIIDDRALSHLKIVTTSKLRRGEGFLLSWTEGPETGSGRGSVWIHSHTDLWYEFDGNRAPSLDRDLLDQMGRATGAGTGLHIDAIAARSA